MFTPLFIVVDLGGRDISATDKTGQPFEPLFCAGRNLRSCMENTGACRYSERVQLQ
jgi:hypothetical protein